MNNLAIALLRQQRSLNEARALAERAVNSGGAQDSLYRATLDEIRAAPRGRELLRTRQAESRKR